jgi:LemA protein
MLEPSSSSSSRRGAAAKGCLVAAGVLILLGLLIGGCGVGKYNTLAAGRANVQSKWAAIDSQYKRRYDLIPNLVATVQGAADFEKSTLQAVTDARASVGRAQLPSQIPTDPAQLDAYIKAQQNLSGALSRMFVVAENYPQLKATANFQGLQDEIAGTENRVNTARIDYIEAVRNYNTSIATFPSNVIAGMFHFETVPQLEIQSEERTVPKVDFSTKK